MIHGAYTHVDYCSGVYIIISCILTSSGIFYYFNKVLKWKRAKSRAVWLHFYQTQIHSFDLHLCGNFLALKWSSWAEWSGWVCVYADQAVQCNFSTCFSMKLHVHLSLLGVQLSFQFSEISIFKHYNFQRAIFIVRAQKNTFSVLFFHLHWRTFFMWFGFNCTCYMTRVFQCSRLVNYSTESTEWVQVIFDMNIFNSNNFTALLSERNFSVSSTEKAT